MKKHSVLLPILLLVILCLCSAGFADSANPQTAGTVDEQPVLPAETDSSGSYILRLWDSLPDRIKESPDNTDSSGSGAEHSAAESIRYDAAGTGNRSADSAESVVLELAGILADIDGYEGVSSAATLKEFAALLAIHAARLEDSFTIPCKPSVIAQLKKNVDYTSDVTLLREVLSMSGACGSFRYNWLDDGVRLSEISYYPGWRILRAWRNGNTETLTAREKRTLEEALALVAGASGTDLEKERYIYDALCARVTYDDSDTDGIQDKDCAVGALLNGLADCDGYADAMMLCCRLAGVPCRYMHGDSREKSDEEANILHMWNLVCIDGTWLMADVTWGDKPDPRYLYFNLGKQDAADSYVWCQEALFTDVADTADFSRHLTADLQPVTVRTMDDVYTAMRSATTAGLRRLTLFCPGEPLWKTDPDTFSKMLHSGAAENVFYSECGRMYEIFYLITPDTFCFCDSESDLLSAISGYKARNIRSFSLYFRPSLGRVLFENDRARLNRLLSRSCLAEPGSFYYSTGSNSITLKDASFINPLPSCSSAKDMTALIRRELPSRPGSLGFLLPDSLSFADIKDELTTAVYSMGVSDFRYSTIGNRVTLKQLTYYPDYCLASSEADVSSYLKSEKKAGKTSVRCYCPESLYQSLFANNASRFFALLKQAGFSHYSVRYNETYGLLYAEDLR